MTALFAACGEKLPAPPTDGNVVTDMVPMPGDSTRYGLACDGCTDSVLVFLPNTRDRLDTFDIIEAHRLHHIYGRPHIGDELAITVNPQDTIEALSVINLEELRGTWCYMVTPTLRNQENMHPRMQRHMAQHVPDSVMRQWMQPKEYSLRLKRDNTVMVYGGSRQQTSDDLTPVRFPSARRYTEWRIYNGRIIMKADTISGFSQKGEVPTTDTVSIKLLMKDTLVLQFPDHEQSYYRKKEKKK